MGSDPARRLLLCCLLLVAFLGAHARPAALGPAEPAGNATLEAVLDPKPCVPQHAPVRTRSGCARNWFYHRGYCYGYFAQRRTQSEAEEECSRYGPQGTLTSIHRLSEATVLAEYVSGQKDEANVWIGLKDNEHTREWRWSDSSPLDFTRWDRGQPNNMGGIEFCVVLYADSGFQLWHDYPCHSRFPFLCQHEL